MCRGGGAVFKFLDCSIRFLSWRNGRNGSLETWSLSRNISGGTFCAFRSQTALARIRSRNEQVSLVSCKEMKTKKSDKLQWILSCKVSTTFLSLRKFLIRSKKSNEAPDVLLQARSHRGTFGGSDPQNFWTLQNLLCPEKFVLAILAKKSCPS